MLPPIRPFKCPFMSVVKQGRKHQLLRQRQVSNKVNFLLICVSEKCHFVSECSEGMCLEKNVFKMYLADDGAKDSVIFCDHVHFSHRNEWTKNCFLCPKEVGLWRNPWPNPNHHPNRLTDFGARSR